MENQYEISQSECAVKNLMENQYTPLREYKNTFATHCVDYGPRLSTGYLQLDIALKGGLANELYILAAETSTGKSAFMMAIAQNIAEQGDADVLYFSLEMGKDEFVARGISAISHEAHKMNSGTKMVTTADVLYWRYETDGARGEFVKMPYKEYEPYADEYFKRYGDHLYIFECGVVPGGVTADAIADIAKRHRDQFKRPVVVFVDYLQLLATNDLTVGRDRKSKTDASVVALKALASQARMPVFTISSVQRASYGSRVGTAAFKESGDTEYNGSLLIGWNWCGVTDEEDEGKRKEQKRMDRNTGYRNMLLEIMKYRNADRDNEVKFRYYPAYNTFEIEENDTDSKVSATEKNAKTEYIYKKKDRSTLTMF